MDQGKELQTIYAIWGVMIYYTWQVRKWKLLKQTIVNTTFAIAQIQKEIRERIG